MQSALEEPNVSFITHFSGPGIFSGYLNRPEVTANVMVKLSFDGKERSFYRTGDFVRMCPVSNLIYYIGRKDFQVKLRGQRIECGEIEHVLSFCPNLPINRAVVVKLEHEATEYLVAYLELDKARMKGFQDIDINGQEIQQKLRIHCQRHLPEYMVPSLFVVLHRLPLNLNGKLDRKALPVPNMSKELVVNYQPSNMELAESEMEQTVLKLWQELLNASDSEISVTANLFDLGGSSLLLMHLVRLYETRLPNKCVALQMADFFRFPTIREHARFLEGCLISPQ